MFEFIKKIFQILFQLKKNVITEQAPIDVNIDKVPVIVLPEVLPDKKLYVTATALNVRSSPEQIDGEKSNKIGTLKLGQEITYLDQKDKWIYISGPDGLKGWVSSYHVTEYLPTVIENPKNNNIEKNSNLECKLDFKKGIANLATDQNTIKLRKFINDELHGGLNSLALQCTEYVLYKLKQHDITVEWPVQSGRDGGKWPIIFEKDSQHKYKVLDYPKVGCAMCFTAGFKDPRAAATGHVAYIEEVLPDGSVRISEANWPPLGKYFERVIPQAEWQNKWKAKFVDFS
ncbi:MAG: CHAP domain-containing protein [Patescibacteria group bacterium]|jgi:surface antigen